jgi:dipeptidase
MKTRQVLWFSCSALSILLLFPATAELKAHDRPPTRDKCTTVIVGKNATAHGSVLLGHNEDWGEYPVPLQWKGRQQHASGESIKLHSGQSIPQVAETFAFLLPAATCNGINEHQVMITDNSGSCRKEMAPSPTGIELDELVAITLERSRTARQAVETMGHLIDQCRYNCVDGPGGDIFSIADPTEGWWMEITTVGQWVAQRVPDDCFVVIANQFRIGAIDLENPSRFLASSNVVGYAKEKGWFDPAAGDFQFWRAYSRPGNASAKRQWRGNCLLGGRPVSQDNDLLAVVPARKLGPRDLMALLRDHFEGTEHDLTKGYEKGSPHNTAERGICRMYTDASTVAHLRGWLPPEIGGVLWFSAGTPCSSVFLPFYLGVEEFPKPYASISRKYTSDNAFWVFNALENLVDHYYADKGATVGGVQKPGGERAVDHVSACWKNFEDQEFASQSAFEKTALELYKQDKGLARSFLTKYSGMFAFQAYLDAQRLADDLRTKHDR